MAEQGLSDIYAQLLRPCSTQGRCRYISKTPSTTLLKFTYVSLSIFVYSIACTYPIITTLQVRYVLCGKTLPYQPHITEAEEKMSSTVIV